MVRLIVTIRGAEAGGFFLISRKATERRFWLMHCAVLAADLVVLENALLTGWVQIFAIGGMIDFFNIQAEPTKYPGDYELFGTFGMIDEGNSAVASSGQAA